MTQQQKTGKEIQIRAPDEVQRGVYCNLMIVGHTKEEFIMDFILVTPPKATLTARVIMSPGHMKRTVSALQDNLAKYEKDIAKIEPAAEPAPRGKLGFRTT